MESTRNGQSSVAIVYFNWLNTHILYIYRHSKYCLCVAYLHDRQISSPNQRIVSGKTTTDNSNQLFSKLFHLLNIAHAKSYKKRTKRINFGFYVSCAYMQFNNNLPSWPDWYYSLTTGKCQSPIRNSMCVCVCINVYVSPLYVQTMSVRHTVKIWKGLKIDRYSPKEKKTKSD